MRVNSDKNILILTTVSGFLCKFEIENVKILQQLGYVVHYATNMKEQHYHFDEKELKRLNVRVHHIDIARSPYMLRANAKALAQLTEIVEQQNIQAVHSHAPVGGVLARLLGKRFKERNLKVIYTAHGFHFYKGAPLINNTIYYHVEKHLAKGTDVLLVINEEDYQSVQKFRLRKGGILRKISGVGLDMEKFHPFSEAKRKEQRKKLGIGETDIFALSVGELNANKNQGTILKALAKRRQRDADAQCIKYGICGDGFLKEHIHSEIKRLQLEDVVTMFQYCTNIPEILGCADFLIFPSQREGLGMAGVEALAMQIPVLASNNRGTREYMQHMQNGYVCEYNDIEGFIKGMDYLATLTKEQRSAMQSSATESVKRFDKMLVRSEMKAVYQKLDEML